MRLLYFFVLLFQLFSISAWSFTPAEICDGVEERDLKEDAIVSEEDKSRQAGCPFAGQYQDSLLPDKNATISGKFREGQMMMYTNYNEFTKSLTQALGVINKNERCDPILPSNIRVAYPSLNLEKTAVGTIPISVIPEEELKKFFSEISKDPKYVFSEVENGCWARAHIMAQDFEKRGIRVGKMFIESDNMVVESKKALNGKFTKWKYHVAPVVAVQTKKGVELRVLDAVFFNEPVPVKVWTDRLLSNSSKRAKNTTDVYITDRFAAGPLQGDKLKYYLNDPARGRWHVAETVMAEYELEQQRYGAEDRDFRVRLMKKSEELMGEDSQ